MVKSKVSKVGDVGISFSKDYFSQLKKLFFHPKVFLESISKETDYQKILFFYVKVYIIFSLISTVISSLIILNHPSFSLGKVIVNFFVGIIFSFISPFIGAGIIHLGVLVLGGKEKYFNTFKPLTYASIITLPYTILTQIFGAILVLNIDFSTPQNVTAMFSSPLFWLIMIIALVSLIHSLIFLIMGLSKFQKFSKLKAFFSIIFVPIAILILVVIILVSIANVIPKA